MDTTSQPNLTETLMQIVLRFAPRDRASALQMTPQTHLIHDAGIDSPRMIDIVLDIEDRIGCTIDDVEAQRVRTFGDLVSMVGKCHAADSR